MAEEADALWKHEVSEVSELGPADFEPPNCTLHITNPSLSVVHFVNDLGQAHEVNRPVVIDRAVRCLIAGYCDAKQLNLRERYGVTTLIPPEGWVFDNQEELPKVDPGPLSNEERLVRRTLTAAVPSTVYSMMFDLIEEFSFFDSHEDVALRAISFLASSLSVLALQRDYTELPEIREDQVNPTRYQTRKGEGSEPFPLNEVMGTELRRDIVAFFLFDVGEGAWLEAEEIAHQLDMSNKSVYEHLSVLTTFGLLNKRHSHPAEYSLAAERLVVSLLYDINHQLVREYRMNSP